MNRYHVTYKKRDYISEDAVCKGIKQDLTWHWLAVDSNWVTDSTRQSTRMTQQTTSAKFCAKLEGLLWRTWATATVGWPRNKRVQLSTETAKGKEEGYGNKRAVRGRGLGGNELGKSSVATRGKRREEAGWSLWEGENLQIKYLIMYHVCYDIYSSRYLFH